MAVIGWPLIVSAANLLFTVTGWCVWNIVSTINVDFYGWSSKHFCAFIPCTKLVRFFAEQFVIMHWSWQRCYWPRSW